MERANVSSIPFFKQDLPFKLVKLNDVNHEQWNLTDTVQAVYAYCSKNK